MSMYVDGMRIQVIGAGVSGLTSGICLAEAGHAVTIRTAAPPEQTTSVAAGALWGPVMTGPPDRALGWAKTSLEILSELAGQAGTGVRMVSGKEITPAEPVLPFWAGLLPDLRLCDPAELPPGFAGGWYYTSPLASMPVYLGYLRTRFERAGGVIESGEVTGFAGTGAAVVVNCTGAAARDIVPDPCVRPVRGQVVIAENPGVKEFLIARGEPPVTTYMFPHGETIVLGGTVEYDQEDLTPNPATAERIVAGCARLEPRLDGVRIIEHRVGLRPYRPEVRLDHEELPDGTVLWHNYGHGGAGISLSWGCAQELADSLTRPAQTAPPPASPTRPPPPRDPPAPA
jgi:D-amino-acid oxidase